MSPVKARFALLAQQLHTLLFQAVPERQLLRIELPMPAVHLPGFLAAQGCAEKAFWKDREGDCAIGALGLSWSARLSGIQDIAPAFASARRLLGQLSDPDGCRCLCYLSFSDSLSSIWAAFGYGVVYLPLLELVQTRKGMVLGVNITAANDADYRRSLHKALELIDTLKFTQQLPETAFTAHLAGYRPDLATWRQLVSKAGQQFLAGSMDKVVLSRETRLQLTGEFSPWPLLCAWQQANPQTYQFLLHQKGEIFFGCSPERLVKRLENLVSTEALAGTIARGQNQAEDSQLAGLLMSDSKNIHENRLVLDDICRRLQPLCRSLEADRSHSVVKLRHIQHLRYQLRGVLNPEINDEHLLCALHPTPAVGGTPRRQSRQFIEMHEPYARGLYAGVCGVLAINSSDFSVAIRSARLVDDVLMLYSGAGIVKDSIADDEWAELNNKIATVLDILRQQAAERSSLQGDCPGDLAGLPDEFVHDVNN